jgi:two-component system response regulator
VEDNPDDAYLFRHALRECAIHVQLQQVSNGQLAMDYLRGTGRFADRKAHPLPGLVVLDLHMPGSDGLSVLRWIRKQCWLSGLPVVVLSGTDYGKSMTEAMESGADTYLIKGMDTPELVQLLEHANLNWAATAQPPSAVC